MAASAVTIRRPDGSLDGGSIFPALTLVPGREALEYGLRVHNIAAGPSGQMLRRSALRTAGARFDDSFTWAADWELTIRLFLGGDLVYLPERLNVLDLSAAGRFHSTALSAEQFRDECRVTVRAVCEYGLCVSDELATAALARIDRLHAEHGHDPALGGDRARAHRAVGARIGWEEAGRRTSHAILRRWDGWRPLVTAYVEEFGEAEPVSLALVATAGAGVSEEAMLRDVAAHLTAEGRDPATVPDLSLAVADRPAPAHPDWLERAAALARPDLRAALRAAA